MKITKKSFSQRYFALKAEDESVSIEQGDALTDLPTLVMLDEALQQSDRYMDLS